MNMIQVVVTDRINGTETVACTIGDIRLNAMKDYAVRLYVSNNGLRWNDIYGQPGSVVFDSPSGTVVDTLANPNPLNGQYHTRQFAVSIRPAGSV